MPADGYSAAAAPEADGFFQKEFSFLPGTVATDPGIRPAGKLPGRGGGNGEMVPSDGLYIG